MSRSVTSTYDDDGHDIDIYIYIYMTRVVYKRVVPNLTRIIIVSIQLIKTKTTLQSDSAADVPFHENVLPILVVQVSDCFPATTYDLKYRSREY